jgi:hypothetical protein
MRAAKAAAGAADSLAAAGALGEAPALVVPEYPARQRPPVAVDLEAAWMRQPEAKSIAPAMMAPSIRKPRMARGLAAAAEREALRQAPGRAAVILPAAAAAHLKGRRLAPVA